MRTAPTPRRRTWPGFEAVTIKSDSRGLVDLADFKAKLSDQTAVFMITNPNTVGLFDPQIGEIARLLHDRGALLYLDGANMNAILGIVRPGDMGVDLMHYNAHKTFSGPHGGGGPGAGPIAVREHLAPYLPAPLVGTTRLTAPIMLDFDRPKSIGRVRSFFGNTGILFRAYCYIMSHGPDGLKGIAQHAVLNANYLMSLVRDVYPVPFGESVHARVCRVGATAGEGPRHPGDGYRQAADRFQLPCADGLFPADRPRGDDGRAHRDREPRDARGICEGPQADRPGRPADACTMRRTTRRSAGPTRSRRPRPRCCRGSRLMTRVAEWLRQMSIWRCLTSRGASATMEVIKSARPAAARDALLPSGTTPLEKERGHGPRPGRLRGPQAEAQAPCTGSGRRCCARRRG